MNRTLHINMLPILRGTAVRRGAIFGAILVAALSAFEIFNYSTTAFALSDVLGDLQSAGIRWATVLAIAFCGIDFAGIARLFTPQQSRGESNETWYLFGAWLLAASFNATLTWWGVSVAMLHHTAEGSILVGQTAMIRLVPVMVAVMVWLIRVLIIGTFSLAGENMFSIADERPALRSPKQPEASITRIQPTPSTPRPALTPLPLPEPSYHPSSLSAKAFDNSHMSERK